MSNPEGITQGAWDAANVFGEAYYGRHEKGWVMWPLINSPRVLIALSIMAAKAEERQAIEALVSEYVWDDHALEQATNIGLACHHQSLEILEAIRSRT